MTVTVKRDQSAVFSADIQKVTADTLTLDGASFLKFALAGTNGTTVNANTLAITNSKLTDFLNVDTADLLTGTNVRFE